MNQGTVLKNVATSPSRTSANASSAEPVLRIRAFGSLSILAPVGALGPRDLGGLKAKQLFESLLLSRPASRSKATLATDLWDTAMPQNVSATLENYISMLRHHLFASSASARDVIVTEHDAYRLAPELVDCDLDTFDRVLVQAADARLPEEALQFFDQARHIASGDLLEDEPQSPWVLAWRDHYRRRLVDALLSAAELAVSLGRLADAEDHADQAMIMDPLNERAVRVAMHAAVAMGCQHRALAIYERCRRDLGDRLGIYPSQQTRALQALIVRQQPLVFSNDVPLRATSDGLSNISVSTTVADHARAKGVKRSPRSSGSASRSSNVSVDDDSMLIVLYGACALAQKRGGREGLMRLLDKASAAFNQLQQHDADPSLAVLDEAFFELLNLGLTANDAKRI
jgi:SARP family transcriptional regulator, regulator of embCAB operon